MMTHAMDPFVPFQIGRPMDPRKRAEIEAAYRTAGFSDEEIAAAWDTLQLSGHKGWINDRYVVLEGAAQTLAGIPLRHLQIIRRDWSHEQAWRDLQAIKTLLVGPDNEAVQLYPAERRVVDVANITHLWVLADPATRFWFGFETGGRVDIGYCHQRANPSA